MNVDDIESEIDVGLDEVEFEGDESEGVEPELDGIVGLDGVEDEGVEVEDVEPKDVEIEDAELGGAELEGIKLEGIQLDGVELDSLELDSVELDGVVELLIVLEECRQPEHETVVIVDEFEDEVDGTELLDETEELLKHCEQEFSLELLEVVLHIWHVAVEVIV